MARIHLHNTTEQVVATMADGNPGALTIIMKLLTEYETIDPQASLKGLGVLLFLDTCQIYGTDIYVLFSDKCKRDFRTFIMLLRATQLGFFPMSRLTAMSKDQMYKINITDEEMNKLDEQVCQRLDQFKRKENNNGI